MKTLILIRGLPGSGKSTLARILEDHWPKAYHVESDKYFYVGDVYKYDRSKLSKAIEDCLVRATAYMAMAKTQCVIVSNVFTHRAHMEPYLISAQKYGFTVQVITLEAEFGSDKGVSLETLSSMKSRFER